MVAQTVKCLPVMQEPWVRPPGREDPLEKEMANHSSILAWEIPWTEKSGGLQFMGLQMNQTQLSMLMPHNKAAIPFLGICPKKMKTLIQKDKCTSMFINLVQWLNRV